MITAWLLLAHGGIQLEQPAVVGEETVIVVSDTSESAAAGQTVRVIHRPGLAGEKEQAVGITDGRGRVRWTPSAGGLTKIRAGDEWHTVEVEGPWPIDTLLWLIGLVIAGAGMLGLGIRRSGWP